MATNAELFPEQATSQDARNWLEQSENDGGFEKRAHAAEIEVALANLPEALAATLIAEAEGAMNRGDLSRCTRIASILQLYRSSNLTMTRGTISGLLDRLEDTIEIHCREIDTELRNRLRTHSQNREMYFFTNREASKNAERIFDNSVKPALDGFCTLAADDPDRLIRVRSRCANILGLLGTGWDWSGNFEDAERVLTLALELAQGSLLENTVRSDLARIKSIVEHRRRIKRDGVTVSYYRPLAPANPPPKRIARPPRKAGSAVAVAAIPVCDIGVG